MASRADGRCDVLPHALQALKGNPHACGIRTRLCEFFGAATCAKLKAHGCFANEACHAPPPCPKSHPAARIPRCDDANICGLCGRGRRAGRRHRLGLAQSPAPTETSPSDLQSSPPAGGQTASPRNVERKTTGRPATDIRVGVFINVKNDCSSGPLPTIRLAEPPTRGKVQVKSGKISAKNYKTCLTLEAPAHIAFYRSEAGFNGNDVFTLEVRYPEGRIEIQKITVNVSDTAPAARPSQQPAPTPAPSRPAPKAQSI